MQAIKLQIKFVWPYIISKISLSPSLRLSPSDPLSLFRPCCWSRQNMGQCVGGKSILGSDTQEQKKGKTEQDS